MEVTLEALPKYFGDVYANDQGYTENQYSARASKVLSLRWGLRKAGLSGSSWARLPSSACS